jgi:prevent-host-death family protein
MRVLTPTDLRKRLGEILDAASAGERILIERDHKPLAYLVSVEEGRRLEGEEERIARSLAALDRLVQLGEEASRDHPAPDDGLTIAEWLHQEHERRTDQIEAAVTGRRSPTPPDIGGKAK